MDRKSVKALLIIKLYPFLYPSGNSSHFVFNVLLNLN